MTYPGWWIQYANQNQHVSVWPLIRDSSLGETNLWIRNLKIKASDDIPVSIGYRCQLEISALLSEWLYYTQVRKKISLTQRSLYYCLKNENKLIRAPKNKNSNVTDRFLFLFNQKTIEQKFHWRIIWKWLKKRWCSNTAASMEIKRTQTTSPFLVCPCCPFSLIIPKRITKYIMFMNSP